MGGAVKAKTRTTRASARLRNQPRINQLLTEARPVKKLKNAKNIAVPVENEIPKPKLTRQNAVAAISKTTPELSVKPVKKIETSETLTPSRKRNREPSPDQKFDFSKSPEKFTTFSTPKKVKPSTSPRKASSELTNTAPVVKKTLSLSERLQAIKNKNLNKSTPLKIDEKIASKIQEKIDSPASDSLKLRLQAIKNRANAPAKKTYETGSDLEDFEKIYKETKSYIEKLGHSNFYRESRMLSMIPDSLKNSIFAHFKGMDKIVNILHNRRDTIVLDRILRDVSSNAKITTFDKTSFQRILGLQNNLYNLAWRKGLLIENKDTDNDRFKSEQHQLTVTPNLDEESENKENQTPSTPVQAFIRMTTKHMMSRTKEFVERLFCFVYWKHKEHLKKVQKFGVNGLEVNVEREISDDQAEKEVEQTLKTKPLARWDLAFDISKLYRDMMVKQLPPKPGSSCQTPSKTASPLAIMRSKIQARGEFATTPTTSPQSVSNLTPEKMAELEKLPASLRKKYMARMMKEQAKKMFRDDDKIAEEINNLKSLKEFSRTIKTYLTTKKCNSVNAQTLAIDIAKSTLGGDKVPLHKVKEKLKLLAGISSLVETNLLKLSTTNNIEYLQMHPNLTLKSIHEHIDMAIQKKQAC